VPAFLLWCPAAPPPPTPTLFPYTTLFRSSSAVSLPEVPLLGVLPGTGGLTRLTDKRRVRRDHADVFCTLVEGVRAPRAKEWRLIDDHAKPQQFAELLQRRVAALAATSDRPAGA